MNGIIWDKLKVHLDSLFYEDTDGYGKTPEIAIKDPFSKPIPATYKTAIQFTLL